MLKPLFKYPGGKYNEYKYIKDYIPKEIENYYEPFFGGGGVYFQLKNENRVKGMSYINDFSYDLINFYNNAVSDDFITNIEHINKAWNEIKELSNEVSNALGNEFLQRISGDTQAFSKEKVSDTVKTLLAKKSEICSLNLGTKTNLHIIIVSSLIDKAKRFSKKEITKNNENIGEICISTAIHQGFYFAIRSVYNEWLTDENCSSYTEAEKAAHWFFIREMCYGSMFRFNANGEFNIPYGGYSYNKKDFSDKIAYMKSDEVKNALTKNIVIENLDFSLAMDKDYTDKDFVFLDPPYDTTFSEYDGNAFGKDKHQQLANILKDIKCKWMLVIKNTEFIYGLYNGWANIMSFDKTYMYHTRGAYDQNVEHLIITNY